MLFVFIGQDLIKSARLQRMAVIPMMIRSAIIGMMKRTNPTTSSFSASGPDDRPNRKDAPATRAKRNARRFRMPPARPVRKIPIHCARMMTSMTGRRIIFIISLSRNTLGLLFLDSLFRVIFSKILTVVLAVGLQPGSRVRIRLCRLFEIGDIPL